MDKEETKNKAEYFVAIISEFAKRKNLTDKQAYRYLKRYKAIDLIDRFYGVMHTQSFRDVINDLITFCQSQGGALVWPYTMVPIR